MLDSLFSTNLPSLRSEEEERRTPCNGSTTSFTIIAPKLTSDKLLPICFQKKRHLFPIEGIDYEKQSWRIRERMKTVSVALVLCLNIGVDPPDIVKIDPCAKLECWIDPSTVSAPKAMELIGANLQKQYERWQPRARYKKFHDPTVDDVKKLCTSLRRNAKEERVLFHYNGHGVPRPTTNGEIWVFNKTYTQYIPLSIYDLQAWMGAPSIYVYDCSNAGIIVNSFNQFAEQHEKEIEKNLMSSGRASSLNSQTVTYKNCIQLAACSSNQILPMNSQLPADLFTSCLTTPIRTALKWYTLQAKKGLVPEINTELIDKIPGQLNDRRTMLGELNWIFTAITDTIAWNTLPRDLFQKLFRQDLLVASLFRNFLLAERILRSHDCTPVSSPALPQCFRHPMWSAWDLAVDLALQQLPDILENDVVYQQLPFFEEQLTAFQVWLDRQSEKRLPPEQLPIVLQVLLSQVHRLRALELLARFLDLGPWAVNLALGVGIFPYVLKLLQSSAKELRPVLVFIWAKILAVDNTCQVDLVKDHKYFHAVLQDPTISKEHRTLSAFVLSSIVNNFLLGQTSALQGSLVSICLVQLNDDFWLLRQWLVICLGQLWRNFAKARWSGVRDLAHEKLYPLLKDPVPEVRAAAAFALGTFISSVTDRSEEHANNIDRIIAITLLDTISEDASPLVRLELVAALQWMVMLFVSQFVSVYLQEFNSGNSTTSSTNSTLASTNFANASTHSLERNVNMKRGYSSSSIPNMSGPSSSIPFGSIFLKLWQGIVNLGRDPYPQVAQAAQTVIEFVRNSAICLITAKEATSEKCSGGGSSLSLPPSPNTRTNYLGKTPPTTTAVVNMQMSVGSHIFGMPGGYSTAIIAGANDSINVSATQTLNASRNTSLAHNHSVGKDQSGSLHDETDGNIFNTTEPGQINHLRPLVTTNFIPWAISYFSRPSSHKSSCINDSQLISPLDKNSPEARSREWRFKRNEKIRQSAFNQQIRVGIRGIETQNWVSKTPFTPSIVKFLPYEQHIAVAFKERVSVYDYRRHTVHCYTPALKKSSFTTNSRKSLPSSMSTSSRVTALEFINAHDIGMYAVGYEDGMVRVWQEPSDPTIKESRLVTAWEALPFLKHNRDTTGVVTTWHQMSCHLVVGGCTRRMRVWDVETELKFCDIPTGADANIRLLSSSPNELIAAGCYDGSVRIFDKRCSTAEARIRTYREDSSAILSVCLRDNCSSLITGCTKGTIRIYDLRNQSSVNSWNIGNEALAIAIHQSSNIVACGSQFVSVYGLNGRPQATIRSHDSFMGPKIGQTSCLALHPHKVVLGSGYIDNTIAVYGQIDNSRI